MLSAKGKCYTHCDDPTTLKIIRRDPTLVGCYVCPGGYVSRIVAYGREIDLPWFKEFVTQASRGVSDLRDQDIRTATRYSWDLGLPEGGDQIVLREAYWTQNYRRTKREDKARPAVFLCSNCDSMFVETANAGQALCPSCRVR